MKYYKDDCHHYKVLDNHRVITITDVGAFSSGIYYDAFANIEHYVLEYIKDKTIIRCTKKQYQNAFAKALNTIKNLK